MSGALNVLDLFSGIGGLALGLERTGGFRSAAFCEINAYCRRVLKKHWPDVPCYEDVRDLTAERLAADGIAVDAICGGFPCQDLSLAGRQAGIDGARSGLWAEYARLIHELRPRVVIVENVANLLAGPPERPGAWFGRVLGDLAAIGYDAEWHCLPASHVGAPHERDRVWLAAYPGGQQHQGASKALWGQAAAGLLEAAYSDAYRGHWDRRPGDVQMGRLPVSGEAPRDGYAGGAEWAAEPALGRVAYGVPDRLERLTGLGNAVVPQVGEVIGRAILSARVAA